VSKAGGNRGRDGRSIPTVDMTSEYLEIERRRYHARIRRELQESGAIKDTRTVKEALEEAAPQLERMGWRVTREGEER
jgi:hypothetical protein